MDERLVAASSATVHERGSLPIITDDRLAIMKREIDRNAARCFHCVDGGSPIWLLASDIVRVVEELELLRKQNRKLSKKLKRQAAPSSDEVPRSKTQTLP